ncbi:hypothetical protein J6590_010683 [Homalodisca vitripennis]|nr:hypothetical protein J6590_010683 [Homalodisca vitripennis]
MELQTSEILTCLNVPFSRGIFQLSRADKVICLHLPQEMLLDGWMTFGPEKVCSLSTSYVHARLPADSATPRHRQARHPQLWFGRATPRLFVVEFPSISSDEHDSRFQESGLRQSQIPDAAKKTK